MHATRFELLVSDVDGTLLTHDKVLTDRTVEAVRRLHEAGIGFAITSSRPPPGLAMFVDQLGITTPLGAFNGGVFCDAQLRILDQHPLPRAAVGPVLELLDEAGLDVWVYRDSQWLVRSATGPHVEHEASVVRFTPTVVAGFDDLVSDGGDDIAKVVGVSDEPDRVARAEAALRGQLGDRVSATCSQTYYVDVTHPDANKGSVITYLSSRLSVPTERIAAIGDGQNDVLMFERVGLSVAMGNAAPEVQRAARHVTASNDDDGLAKAIEELVLG